MFKYGIFVLSAIVLFVGTGCTEKKEGGKTIGTGIAHFAGKYQCKGFDPYLQKDYAGTVEITENDVVYNMKMAYDTGEDMIGTGGQYTDDLLFVVFKDKHDPKKVGLEQYERRENNEIAGYWVYLGQNKLGKEVCKKIS